MKLEIYIGFLEAHAETGSEGFWWLLREIETSGYIGMVPIEKGDYLIIYNRKGKVIFKDIIKPDYKIGWEEHPLNRGYGQPSALGLWIHWTQKGWKPDDWARLFIRRSGEDYLRAILMRKK